MSGVLAVFLLKCTLENLFSGFFFIFFILFFKSGQNEFDQMYRIVALLGMPPVHMIETSRKYKNFFDFKGKDEHGNSIFALKPYHKV